MSEFAQVALITGSSSGIGLLTALTLARGGYTVIATMRDLARATDLRNTAMVQGVSGQLDIQMLDVTDPSHIEGIAQYIADTYGHLDLLANNAGYAIAGFAEEMTLDELYLQMDTNFFGAVHLTTALLPLMRTQRSGHIVMLSSISGLSAFPLLSAYNASKFALEGWAEALSMEVKSLGIHVSLVEPGAFETDIWTRNATLTAATNDRSSPNYARSQSFLAAIQKASARRADPQQIADLILRIAQSPSPRLRYLIGKDAQAAYLMRRLLPTRLFQKILLRASGLTG